LRKSVEGTANCRSSSKEIKTWQGHVGSVLDSADGYDVIECISCGFKHIIPVPTIGELADIYREEYYSTEKPLYFEQSKEDMDWWNLVYSDLYDVFEKDLPPGQRRILDVGSGPGFFLLYGKQRGWQTKGIEPSKQAAAFSRDLGLDIFEAFLDKELAKELGSFDVIHMREVLEHVPDPPEMLELAHHLLNPGGLLCVIVPNDYNPFQFALRAACDFQPWWVGPPHHINYFNFDSLSRLFSKSGFEVILKEATFPIDMFLLMGDDYVGNDELGRECHSKRKTFESNLAQAGLSDLKRKTYQAFASLGIGREAQLIGRRK